MSPETPSRDAAVAALTLTTPVAWRWKVAHASREADWRLTEFEPTNIPKGAVVEALGVIPTTTCKPPEQQYTTKYRNGSWFLLNPQGEAVASLSSDQNFDGSRLAAWLLEMVNNGMVG